MRKLISKYTSKESDKMQDIINELIEFYPDDYELHDIFGGLDDVILIQEFSEESVREALQNKVSLIRHIMSFYSSGYGCKSDYIYHLLERLKRTFIKHYCSLLDNQ